MKYFISLQRILLIRKYMKILKDTSIGEVVKFNYRTAMFFQEHDIDFCCGGKKTISEASKEVGFDTDEFIKNLESLAGQADPDTAYINSLNLSELSEYIIKRHHRYVHDSIPILNKNLNKICDVHGEHHPELLEVNDLFTHSVGALIKHMQKEELMLFPYIQRLEQAFINKSELPGSPFGSVSNPIAMMIEDHQQEGDRFDQISKLTRKYKVPEDACTTYELALNQLKEFEIDLHRHIHLENNILFPKAIELEKKFM